MGSMGFLLADWSIEIIRSRARKRKTKEGNNLQSKKAEDPSPCTYCEQLASKLTAQAEIISQDREERRYLANLFAEDEQEADIIENIEKMMREASAVRTEVEELKVEREKMAESIGRQLTDRDTTHEEKVKHIEAVSVEKEKQLLRQQLIATKKENKQMQKHLEQLESVHKLSSAGSPAQEEMDTANSLSRVLNMKTRESEQLRAENNSLMLELKRFEGIELRLEVDKQMMEEMESVISLKNEQLVQVLDKYDILQEQLEMEVSAHLTCEEELERCLVEKDKCVEENEKRWREVGSKEEKGMIMDVVSKEKGLAYRYKC